MKNKKIFLCLFLALAMLFIPLTGCGQKTDDTSDNPVTTPGAVDSPDTSATPSAHSEGIDENGFWEGVKALDYVEMFNYQALSIPADKHQVKDETLQSEIDYMLSGYATSKNIMDRAIADGDVVNMDYVGSVDGVEFDGGNTGGEGTEVTAGSTDYIDDFLIQIIGHKPGETFDVNVTFPEDYGVDELNGKDAVFVTTINHIVESEPAVLNDAFVKENFSATKGWNTVAELQSGLKQDMEISTIQQYIQEYFASEVPVKSVPTQIITYLDNSMVNSYMDYAMSNGIEFEELISSEGYSTKEELLEANRENNKKAATFYLVSQAVAEDMGISISDEDLTEYFSKYAGTSDYTQYKDNFGLPYLKQNVIIQKVLDFISENAVLQ